MSARKHEFYHSVFAYLIMLLCIMFLYFAINLCVIFIYAMQFASMPFLRCFVALFLYIADMFRSLPCITYSGF